MVIDLDVYLANAVVSVFFGHFSISTYPCFYCFINFQAYSTRSFCFRSSRIRKTDHSPQTNDGKIDH